MVRWQPTALRGLAGHVVVRASVLRIATLVVGVGASIAVARLGGPEIKGVSASYSSALSLSFLLLNFDLAQQALRRASEHGEPALAILWLRRPWIIYLTCGVILTVAGAVAGADWTWVVVGSVVNLVQTQSAVAAIGSRGPAAAALAGLVQQLAMLVGALALASQLELSPVSIQALIVASLLAPLPILWKGSGLWRRNRASHRIESLRTGFRNGLVWQIARAPQTIVLKIDVLAVFWLLGAGPAGIYSVGLSTAMLVNVVPQQMANELLHATLRSGRSDPMAAARRASVAGLLVAVAVGAVSPFLVPAIYGTDFQSAVGVVIASLPGAVAYGAIQVFSNYLRVVGTSGQMLALGGIGLGVTILCLPLILALGLVGAAVASSMGMIASLVVGVIVTRRELNRSAISN